MSLNIPLIDPKQPPSTRKYSRIRNSISEDSPQSSSNTPLLIGVGGGSSSGKKEVCKMIMDNLIKKKVQGQVIIIRYTLTDIYY